MLQGSQAGSQIQGCFSTTFHIPLTQHPPEVNKLRSIIFLQVFLLYGDYSAVKEWLSSTPVLNSALLKELGQRCGCMIYPALLPAGCVRCMSATECLGCSGQAPSWDEVSMAENSATTHAEGCACTFPALSTVDGYIKISACVLPSYYCLPNCSGDVHCVEFHRSNYP